jgi:teichuronic acid biosynthesis glycosyltransferase TuaC
MDTIAFVAIGEVRTRGEATVLAPPGSVFVVAPGSALEGVSCLVSEQIASVRDSEWEACLGVVDDRASPGGILRNIRRLKAEISGKKPLVVHAHYGSVTAAVARLARGGVPLVVSFCGDDLLGTPGPGLAWRLRERLGRAIGVWAARAAVTVIVKSRNLLEALPPDLRDRASVLPNGVDTEWFTPMDRDECRRRLGWPQGDKVVLFNASIADNQPVKNLALARAAVERIERPILKPVFRTMSDAGREEVRLMANAADCLLVTSLHEGSPNVVKEAMACNLPVVSVPCGDVVARLNGVSPGRVVPYEAEAIADALADVLRSGRRSNGRDQLLLQGLSADSVSKRLIAVYQMAAASGRR